MSPLSIVIPILNEQDDAIQTVQSIRETAPADVEIILVDDGSAPPVANPHRFGTRLHRHRERLGVSKARHAGCEMATRPYILLTDSHMRFEPGWYEKAIERITQPGREQAMHCGCCLGLGYSAGMDLAKHHAEYCGASLHLWKPKEGKDPASVFTSKWLPGPVEDDAEIPSVMGASYFIPREFYLHIGGLKSLRMYGDEEPFLSLKTWLAGGQVRMLKTVRIGHRFRDAGPYRTGAFELIYNKLRAIRTCCPELHEVLIRRIPGSADKMRAMSQIHKDMKEIVEERKYYESIFKHDIFWFISKFSVLDPRVPV